VLGENGFAPLVHAAVIASEAETSTSALTVLGNLLQGVGDSLYRDDVIGALSRENLFEGLTEAVKQQGALQEEAERVIKLLAANGIYIYLLLYSPFFSFLTFPFSLLLL